MCSLHCRAKIALGPGNPCDERNLRFRLASEVEANRATMPAVCGGAGAWVAARLLGAGGAIRSAMHWKSMPACAACSVSLNPCRHGVPVAARARTVGAIARQGSGRYPTFFPNQVHAAESDFDRLNEWLPDTPEIPEYLIEVRKLLVETSDRVLAKSPLAQGLRQLYRQIIFATGWQESCWRQFIKVHRVIEWVKINATHRLPGDVRFMQSERVSWRSIYDYQRAEQRHLFAATLVVVQTIT